MSNVKLKPCPFCGCGANFCEDTKGRYKFYVLCEGCDVRTQGTAFKNDERNAQDWNRRRKEELNDE